ncbi:ABC transporter substrate-binding protein [Yinghuangia soli]|uniref:ABC transporter substrate-binding protein n=1 Tax=Yinghuangia soli TaxID=2908204 RepID=A0AA41TZ81_9ACTN|nr:ABC transporter substrate-binding protein [Yinghuangia soli]MCF2528568.1 ABC transporter substrate-binding protein [Yinghuangia soli]
MSARRTAARRTISTAIPAANGRTGLARLRARGTVVAGLAAVALTATACGGDSDKKSGGNSETGGTPKNGGKLTMLAVQDSKSLDVFRTSYVAVADEPRLAALYDPMFYIDTKTGAVKPHLAESLSTADNGATWTLKLRPGVQFSDGTPFNAEAVKINYEAHGKAETQSLHRAAAMMIKTEVVDETTVKITNLTGPNPNFDRTVATELTYIEAPSAISKGIDQAGQNPVGAGPFMLKNWVRGSHQEFVKNPNYWQKDKGLPKVDEVVIKNVPDIKQQYNTVKSGGADIFHSSDGARLEEAAKELQVQKMADLGGQMIQFNMNKPPFDDIRARQALSLAFDPADIPKQLNNGYVPAKSYFNESSQFFDPTAVQPAQNKEKAQQLLDALAAEGKPLSFDFLIPQNPSSQAVAEYMQSRLAQMKNVTMKIQSLEIGQYIQKYAIQRDFTAMLFQQWNVDPEPVLFNSFHSKSLLNFVGWRSPAADAALEAGRASTDPAARKAAYAELQKAMIADLPVWVYAESLIGPIYSKKVTGVEQYNTGVVFMDRIGFK